MDSLKWNGEPCKTEFFTAILVEGGESHALGWYKPFIGQRRQMIKVTASWGEPFVIDNQNGTGYAKMRNGGAMLSGGHASIPNFIHLLPVEAKDIIKEVDYDLINKERLIFEGWAQKENPKEFERMKMLESMIKQNKFI